MPSQLSSSAGALFRLNTSLVRLIGCNDNRLLKELAVRLEPCTDLKAGFDNVDIELNGNAEGIQCLWYQGAGKPLRLMIDVDKFVKQQRTFPAPKQGALNQALGRKSKSIIDATGGWGGDALLFWSQGYRVAIIERNPIMGALLRDAMQRLGATDWAAKVGEPVPAVIEADARNYFINTRVNAQTSVDCVYLDPMFPAKSKSTAGVNKRIQFLQYLVGADLDAEQMALAVLRSGVKRVVVKRPHHAVPLMRAPDEQFVSKLVHYDVYLNNASNRMPIDQGES